MTGQPTPDPAAIREAVQGRAQVFQTGETPLKEPTLAHAFRLLGLAELLQMPKPPQWLVRGYLEECVLACIYGESGSMKTFCALDLVLCIATGFPWHGFSVPKPGPVVYVAGEGAAGLPKRIMAWSLANEVSLEGVPFYALPQAVPMLDAASVLNLIDVVAALPEPPKLIVVDTLSRCLDGDENSSTDMGAFVRALDRLRIRFGCCVLVIHHSGLSERTRGRGSSVFRAACDWEYRLDVHDSTRTLVCTKTKDHEEPAPLHFAPTSILTGWLDEDGQAIASIVLKLSGATAPLQKPLGGAARIAYEALNAVLGQDGRAHLDVWRMEAYKRGISGADTPEARKKAFQTARRTLLDTGRIKVSDPYYWPSPGENGKSPGGFPATPAGRERECVLKDTPVPPGSDSRSQGREGRA